MIQLPWDAFMVILEHTSRYDFVVVRKSCKLFAQSWVPVWNSRFCIHVMAAIADTINFEAVDFPCPLHELMWLCSVVGEFMVHGPNAIDNSPQRRQRHRKALAEDVHNDAGLLFAYNAAARTLVACRLQRRRRFPYFTAVDWADITHNDSLDFGLI